MAALNLPRHPGLFSTTRLRLVVSQHSSTAPWEWLILISAGVLAACSSVFLDLESAQAALLQVTGIQMRQMRIPGHAILRVVFPMAVGLALVPRRGAGSVMASSAFLTGVSLHLAGFKGEGLGVGALTSLTATGPMLDWTLRHANGGWRQYAAFGLAGLVSNLLAFVARGGAKVLGWEAVGRRGLMDWLAQASVTYVLCGLAAGLISGAILFYGRSRGPGPSEGSAE